MVMRFVFRALNSRDRCGWQRARGIKGKYPNDIGI